MTLHTSDLPTWLTVIAWVSIILGALSAIGVAIDVRRRPQPMRVMDLVWPICALFGSLLWVAAYLWWGRAAAPDAGAEPTASPGASDSGDDAPKDAHAMTGMTMKGIDMPGMDMAGMSMKPALGLSASPTPDRCRCSSAPVIAAPDARSPT